MHRTMPRALLAVASFATTALCQLPPLSIPTANPITPEKAMLGKILFWEEQLSSDDSVAVAVEGARLGYRVLSVRPDDRAWADHVLDALRAGR